MKGILSHYKSLKAGHIPRRGQGNEVGGLQDGMEARPKDVPLPSFAFVGEVDLEKHQLLASLWKCPHRLQRPIPDSCYGLNLISFGREEMGVDLEEGKSKRS